jgi:hypothetical protein
VTEFRCRVGHRYSLGAALDAHEDAEERAVWSAVEKLEEGADLSEEAGQKSRAGAKRDFARELRELKDTTTKRLYLQSPQFASLQCAVQRQLIQAG